VHKDAKDLADAYTYISFKDMESGVFVSRSIELPLIFAEHKIRDHALSAVIRLNAEEIEAYMKNSEAPPRPIQEKPSRSVQVNIRLTGHEHLTLISMVPKDQTLSEYVRRKALGS